MLHSINDYINLLTQEELLRKKEEESYFTFSSYSTQRSMYKHTPLKFSPPSIDFDYQLPNSKTKYPYPFPVNLSQRTHDEKDEHEKSLYAEQIMSFLNPFLDALVTERHRNNASDTLFGHVVHRFESYCKEHEAEKNHLKELMGVERLVIPFMDINLPGEFVLAYNELDAEDPQVSFYQQHTLIAPEIRKLGVFLNRYDTNEEVLCHFVWSTVDALLIALPSVNLNPYPLCWTCQNTFATKVCAGCHVAKYCSKECQRQDWNTLKGNIPGTPKTNHKHLCRELSDLCTEHNVLTL